METHRLFLYICKRLALMVLTFLVIATLCFFLIKLLPLPAIKEQGRDVALLLQRREAMGYGKPIYIQYLLYWKHLLRLDLGLGEQMYVGQEVSRIILDKIPYTVAVNLYAILLAIPIGLGLGIFAALRKNRWQDHAISTAVVLFISVPSYVYAFLIQYLLCFRLQWFPLQMNAGTAYFTWSMFRSMIPAVLALSLGSIAGYARFTRAELTEVLTGEYLLLARAKGLTRRQTTVRHALRNAMVPIFPSIIAEVVAVLGGSLIIESIFGVPGVGRLYVSSITALDYNFFMLLSAFYTRVGLAAGIVVDVSYGLIDPRIRMGSKK